MYDLLAALRDPDAQFLRLAFAIAALASLAFGTMGTYVVTRRISYLAGAVSHCAFGGIGAALYLRATMGWAWLDPMYGAVVAALAAAIIVGLTSLYASQREDTVIGTVWAVGMAIGLLFLDRTPGYFDMTSVLFGDIMLISMSDLWLVAVLDVVVVGLSLYFYNQLMAVCFDDEFANLRAVPSAALYILLLCMAALTVVLMIRVVGIVLVIALLTIPAATAGQFAKRLWRMMALSVFFCLVFTWGGLAISFSYNLSSGPTIIVLAGSVYLTVLLGKRLFSKRNS